MELQVNEDSTRIFPTNAEVEALCTPGKGADTCVWLTISGQGFECSYYNKPLGLMDRYQAGLTTAKRNGCDAVKKLRIFGTESRTVDVLAKTGED